MGDPIVSVRHAVPVWRLLPRKRHETLSAFAETTPVRLPSLDSSEMRLAFRRPQSPGVFVSGGEHLDASLWEAEGRLWEAAERIDDDFRVPVGPEWLEGRRGRKATLDLFAARTPLSRLALGLADEYPTGSVVEAYDMEARAGLTALVERDVRLVDGRLYHAFQGMHVGIRLMDWFVRTDRPFAATGTAYPRTVFEGYGERFAVRADRAGAISMLEAMAGMGQGSARMAGRDTAGKRQMAADAGGVEDVVATVNALPDNLMNLLRRGSAGRQAVSAKMRDLDLGDLRRPMALGSLGLIDEAGADAALRTVSRVIEDGLACSPGIRLSTSLRHLRAYVDRVAAPALAERAGLSAEDDAALVGIAP